MYRLRLDEVPDVVRPRDCQAVLGLGRSKIYDLLRRGDLRSVRCGHSILIPKAALVEFLSRGDAAGE